jgi:pilus assembly protein CpaF
LYNDPDISEILVDSPERVLVERRGAGLEDSGVRFDSAEALRSVVEATLAVGGVRLGEGETLAEARLGQEARMLVVLPPTALQGPYLVIRKLKMMEITWERLLGYGSVTTEEIETLKGALAAPKNILVAGGTGSGKTTVANLLADLIPSDERLVVVEAYHEFNIRHPRAIFLEAGGPANIKFEDLISTGAKMRPDWLVVSELLGPEAARVLEIFGRGHSGITTLHAASVGDALNRLEAMCLMANLGLGLGEIRSMIAAALQVITYQQHLASGRRVLTHIVELRGLENDRYVLQPLFRYNAETGKVESTGAQPLWKV